MACLVDLWCVLPANGKTLADSTPLYFTEVGARMAAERMNADAAHGRSDWTVVRADLAFDEALDEERYNAQVVD